MKKLAKTIKNPGLTDDMYKNRLFSEGKKLVSDK